MIVRESSRVHPVLDMSAADKAFTAHTAEKQMTGEQVTSAWDLYSVETLRELHNLRIGDAFPTDVFVFGKGETDNPASTKVGGRPFWPCDREWPTAADGSHCHFLAQFNFADSLDIVGDDLPGTVLLLLTDSKEDWIWGGGGLSFHWVSAGITPAKDLVVPSAIGAAGPFYGVIHRSADYPDAWDDVSKLKVSQSYNLPILNGTKIGGLPHLIQDGGDYDSFFLCQLSSIQAAPFAPYPWVNECDPLGLDFNNKGIYGKENCAVFGDMGSVYLFIDANGKVSRSFESY